MPIRSDSWILQPGPLAVGEGSGPDDFSMLRADDDGAHPSVTERWAGRSSRFGGRVRQDWLPTAGDWERTHRRGEVRKPVRLPVEVIPPYGEHALSLFATDLSPAGLFVRGIAAVVPGDSVVVSFRLPGADRELVFFGEVRRVPGLPEPDEGVPLGFGVRFVDATPFERLRIRDALRPIPPPVPRAPAARSAGR